MQGVLQQFNRKLMKTAVETLFDRIEEIGFIDPAAGQFYEEVISLKEQAKAMEKEQMMQCYEDGYNRVAKLIENATQRNL